MNRIRSYYRNLVSLLFLAAFITNPSASSSRGTFTTAFPMGTSSTLNSRSAGHNTNRNQKHFVDSNDDMEKNNRKSAGATSGGLTSTTSLAALPLLHQMQNPVLNALGVYVIIDVLGFIISLTTKSHVHLDLLGTGAFAVAALAWPGYNNNQILKCSSIAVAVWGTKLALFLFARAGKVGHDGRLSALLSTPRGMFDFWAFTGIWQWCLSLPFLLGRLNYYKNGSATAAAAGSLSKAAPVIGTIVYSLGLAIETIADVQKWQFKNTHASNEFCNIGLWKISQHPNFFGNWLLWVGIFIMNVPALININAMPLALNRDVIQIFWSRYWKLIVAMIGPWFSYQLFDGQAQGSFLNSVDLAKSKYGHDPNYATYLAETPLLFPTLISLWKALFEK